MVRTHKHANGAVSYYAQFRGPDGLRKTEFVRRVAAGKRQVEAHKHARAAAEKQSHEQRVKVKNNEWQPAAKQSAITFDDLCRRFLRLYRPRSGSVSYYEERLKPAREQFGKRPARSVGVADVERYRNQRLDAVGSETVRKDLVALSLLFRWANDHGLAEGNPADHHRVKRPPKAKPNPQPWTAAELEKLLATAADDFRRVLVFALETGVDRAEIVNLTWPQVRSDRIDMPRGKTGEPRTVHYGQSVALRGLLAQARLVRLGSGAVFLTAAGEPWTGTALSSRMTRALKRAGVKKRKPWKSLRATFATAKHAAGLDAHTIAAMMGLSLAHVLEYYVKVAETRLQDAMAVPVVHNRMHNGSGIAVNGRGERI